MSPEQDPIQARLREAETALHGGDRDRGVALLHAARAAARELASDDAAMLRDYVWISLHIADLEAQAERYDAAAQVLAETQARCHRLGAPAGELWAVTNLLALHLHRGDLMAASTYAAMVTPLFTSLDEPGEQAIPSPDRAQVYQSLTDLAERVYYEAEDYEAARQTAAAAVQLLPDEPLGHYLLGLALIGLERYDEAIPTWQRLVTLSPDLPFVHVNLAGALGSAGRVEEAVEAMSRALELAPGKVRYWFVRGQWNERLGRHEAAIADYDRVLELAAEAADEPPPATAPQSRAAYERDLPVGDLADLAALFRLRSMRALGRIDAAIQSAHQIVRERDEVTAQAARMFLGDVYESLGRHDAAIDIYTQVLAGDRPDEEARHRRARLYLADSMFDEAAEDLAVMAGDQDAAGDAIVLLNQLLDRAPGHAGAGKALGHAYLSAWQPAKAVETLTAALAALPEDWEVRYWRGLADLIHGDETGEAETAWNSSFDRGRVTDAAGDLAAAATRTTDPRPSAALRWLAERAAADPALLEWLASETVAAGSRLAQVLPELAPVPKLLNGASLGASRRWREAVDELIVARTQLAEAGLNVLTIQADLLLADNYLRLYEIQTALDYLDAAEDALPLLARPLDEAMQRRAEEAQEHGQEQGTLTYVIDLDHLEFHSLTAGLALETLQFLRAQARARIGDPARAVEVIDNAGGVQQLLAGISDGQISPSMTLGYGTILRDAGRLDDALAVAEQLLSSDIPEEFRAAAHNFAGTVLEFTGDLDGAAGHFQAALNLAERDSPETIAGITVNLAMVHLQRREPQQALDLADAHQPPPDAHQPIRTAHHAIRGEALLDLGDYAGAQRELGAALAIQDEARSRLRTYEDRMTWHAKELKVRESAVLAAVLNRDLSAALDLVERSKARAFVDQLAAAQLPPAAEPGDLTEILGRVQARRRLLRLLSVSAGAGYLDHELLRQLAELGGGKDLIDEGEDGAQRLAADRLATELARDDANAKRLETRIENARLAAVESIVGAVLSPDEVRGLLTEGHRQPGDDRQA